MKDRRVGYLIIFGVFAILFNQWFSVGDSVFSIILGILVALGGLVFTFLFAIVAYDYMTYHNDEKNDSGTN